MLQNTNGKELSKKKKPIHEEARTSWSEGKWT